MQVVQFPHPTAVVPVDHPWQPSPLAILLPLDRETPIEQISTDPMVSKCDPGCVSSMRPADELPQRAGIEE
jgi:hypothetical protein